MRGTASPHLNKIEWEIFGQTKMLEMTHNIWRKKRGKAVKSPCLSLQCTPVKEAGHWRLKYPWRRQKEIRFDKQQKGYAEWEMQQSTNTTRTDLHHDRSGFLFASSTCDTGAGKINWWAEIRFWKLFCQKGFFLIINSLIFKQSLATYLKIKSFQSNVTIHPTSIVSSARTKHCTIQMLRKDLQNRRSPVGRDR